MKFDTPAGTNPIDQLTHIGRATDRIDGRHKVTGTATYAYEWHDSMRRPAYGFIVGAAIAKGRIASLDLRAVKSSSGVLAIVTVKLTRENGHLSF
jgi:xanthine dehydrogenase YagR molybdenum-binding subunit